MLEVSGGKDAHSFVTVRFDMSKGTKKGFGDAQSGFSEPCCAMGAVCICHTQQKLQIYLIWLRKLNL